MAKLSSMEQERFLKPRNTFVQSNIKYNSKTLQRGISKYQGKWL